MIIIIEIISLSKTFRKKVSFENVSMKHNVRPKSTILKKGSTVPSYPKFGKKNFR